MNSEHNGEVALGDDDDACGWPQHVRGHVAAVSMCCYGNGKMVWGCNSAMAT